jgi:ABC-type branched-subunit amino acid transport system substrate-binding protein
MKSDVLALQHTIGSPINTALADQMTADNMVNIPEAWARNLTQAPGNAIVGATYDVEMINGLDYLLAQGKIKEGDKLGHIYFEGEYGANGLAGSKYFASQHNMTIDEAQIKSTDTDMSSVVTRFKADGVAAILLTVAPQATASAAGVSQQVGLNVPILGSNPVYAPGLLTSAAGPVLKERMWVASPVPTFDAHQDMLDAYTKAYPGATPSLGAVHGYADSIVMDEILEAACKAGDLTPEGVLKAKQGLKNPDTQNYVTPLDYSKGAGQSPSTQSYILQPADGPGGAKTVQPATEGKDVANYKPGS